MILPTNECIEREGYKDRWGYGQKHVRRPDGNWVTMLAHRWTWEQANGPIPEGLCVLHRCDNPPCINLNHLFLGTLADNAKDAQEKGRMPTAQHGTRSKYINNGCRCADCIEANRKYVRKQVKKWRSTHRKSAL